MTTIESRAETYPEAPAVRRRGWRVGMVRFSAHPPTTVGLLVLFLVAAAALLAPLAAPHNPLEVALVQRLKPPAWQTGGAWQYPLGTDQLGRDVLSRLIYGARFSLLIAAPATVISLFLGVIMGLWAGYAGGTFERALMRWIDFQRSIPPLLVAILVLAFIGRGVLPLVLFLGFWNWNEFCRLVRGQSLSIRENVYIEAARAVGCGPLRIIVRHMLPNVVAPVIVLVTFYVPFLVIIESVLSYLGLGVQPPAPSWGNMLAEGRSLIITAPWLTLTPAIVLSLTVLAFNMVGDRLRDFWDPRLRKVAR